MKRRVLILCSISIFLLAGLTGCDQLPALPTEVVSENTDVSAPEEGSVNDPESEVAITHEITITAQTGSFISESEATEIAIKDAGIQKSDITGLRVRLKVDDGVNQYEVDFYVGNKEYDYKINAIDKSILSKTTNIDDDFRQDKISENSDPIISKDEAIKIAMAQVKGSLPSDVRIHLENEDGKIIYEGSIVYNETEYDFEINALTGNILEWQEGSVYD